MKKQKVNWVIYLILDLVSLGIVFFSLLIAENLKYFTIVSGIGCGAFASVMVALLIEIFNVSQKNKRNHFIFESYFSKLYFNFACLLSSFEIVCDKEKKENTSKQCWFNWLERIIEEQLSNNSPSKSKHIIEILQKTEDEFIRIEESKLQLLNIDIIEDMEFVSLKNIQLDLLTIKNELKRDETDWAIIKMVIPELKENIEKSKILKKFNRVVYKDDLSDLIYVRCY